MNFGVFIRLGLKYSQRKYRLMRFQLLNHPLEIIGAKYKMYHVPSFTFDWLSGRRILSRPRIITIWPISSVLEGCILNEVFGGFLDSQKGAFSVILSSTYLYTVKIYLPTMFPKISNLQQLMIIVNGILKRKSMRKCPLTGYK